MKILYLSHNGIETSLVRSQVLPYLREASLRGIESHVMTFERDAPGAARPSADVAWTGLRARPGSGLLSKALDIIRGSILAVRLVRRERASVIHARSYVAAAIALVTGIITRRPFIFDMRGFLGDEYIGSGHWTASDPRYRVLRIAELVLLRTAAAVVVLTEAAAARLRGTERYREAVSDKPIVVVRCAVDLKDFRPGVRRQVPTLVYSGSVASWYFLDEMLAAFRASLGHLPGIRFRFINRGEHQRILTAVLASGLDSSQVEIREADFKEMPDLLAECHVGIVFAHRERSIGASPIKIAEYLACGVPVVGFDSGAPREVAPPGYGSFVPYGDLEALEALLRAVRRGEAGLKSAAECVELAGSCYSQEAMVVAYEAIYQRVIEST